MNAMFDPNLYATVPTRTTAGTLSLARGLLSAAGVEPEERVGKRLAKLRKAAKLLQVAWVEAGRPAAVSSDPRSFDVAVDRSWSALRMTRSGHSRWNFRLGEAPLTSSTAVDVHGPTVEQVSVPTTRMGQM